MEIRPAVLTFVFVASSILTMFLPSTAQESPKTEAPKTVAVQQRVFVFVQRTDRHAKHSSQEMFHDAMNAVFDYLKQKNVAIAVDDFGGRNHAEGATPMETVFSIARDAKADTVLWVEVDRPLSKWLKVTIQCYDMNNKLLWEEKAESGGGFSGAHGLEVTTKRIQEGLDKHIAQPGLPVLAKDATPSAEAQ